jgi:DNA-binding sugar fermentation-stimulating protein
MSMIKETQLQHDVIKAVREIGGAANKLSNRFLVGVSDLLVKISNEDAMLIEVKKNVYSAEFRDAVTLDVTTKQLAFLNEYARAGMRCGVLSFLVKMKRGKRVMSAAMFDVMSKAWFRDKKMTVGTGNYTLLRKGDEYYASIRELLLDDWS